MCDDAPNPWVNSTTGPDPVASWKIKVLTLVVAPADSSGRG